MGWRQTWMSVLYPNRCCLCHRVIPPHDRYCRTCAAHAAYILPPVCERCGRNEDVCLCRGRRRLFERCVAPFYHEGFVRQGIIRLKSAGWHTQVKGFAAEMAEVVRREYGGIGFHMVTAVPLHKREHCRRGFNPAALLAEELATLLAVPYVPVLKKVYVTRPQKSLSARERGGNLLGAFDVTDPALLPQRTVLLVDDVITTGSTLEECAKMLKIYGAAQVFAVTVAAAVLQKDEK